MRGFSRYDEAKFQDRLWDPSILKPKLVLWFDAFETSTFTVLATGRVSQWNDKSGNNWHASQTVDTNRPPFDADGINNRPALVWDGVQRVLNIPTVDASPASFSIFAFVRLDSVTTPRTILSSQGSGGLHFRINQTTGTLGLDKRSVINIANGTTAIGLTTAVVGVTYSNSTGAWAFYINGRLDSSGTNVQTFTANTAMWIGYQASQYFHGAFGEIIRVDSILNTADRQKLEGYLAWKWGVSLVSNHQHANGPALIGA